MNVTINNEKKYFCFLLFQKTEIYKNIILICYIIFCPILIILEIIWYLFNLIKLIYCNLFFNCNNNSEKDLENQYIINNDKH